MKKKLVVRAKGSLYNDKSTKVFILSKLDGVKMFAAANFNYYFPPSSL